MITAYKKMWINAFNFKGRSTRSNYWYVVLTNIIIYTIISILTGLVSQLSVLNIVYYVVTFIPSLALAIRRFHDINKSGWSYLLILVPVVGWIMLVVFLCMPSVNENNKYGEVA